MHPSRYSELKFGGGFTAYSCCPGGRVISFFSFFFLTVCSFFLGFFGFFVLRADSSGVGVLWPPFLISKGRMPPGVRFLSGPPFLLWSRLVLLFFSGLTQP